jgi:hypothetical protein
MDLGFAQNIQEKRGFHMSLKAFLLVNSRSQLDQVGIPGSLLV